MELLAVRTLPFYPQRSDVVYIPARASDQAWQASAKLPRFARRDPLHPNQIHRLRSRLEAKEGRSSIAARTTGIP